MRLTCAEWLSQLPPTTLLVITDGNESYNVTAGALRGVPDTKPAPLILDSPTHVFIAPGPRFLKVGDLKAGAEYERISDRSVPGLSDGVTGEWIRIKSGSIIGWIWQRKRTPAE